MPPLSINADIALLLSTTLGLPLLLLLPDIIVGLFERGKVGAAQSLGQPAQGLLGHVPHTGVGVCKSFPQSTDQLAHIFQPAPRLAP